jgi:hypothetical protein
MKKFVSYFLFVSIVVSVQFFKNNIVNAMSVTKFFSPNIRAAENNALFPIPRVVEVNQISTNQIEITYDRDIDMNEGIKSTNYWIQDTVYSKPIGIATLGREDKVNSGNSLTYNRVKIEPRRGSTKTVVLTFRKYIPIGVEYKLSIYHVTVKEAPPYSGVNGMATFVGK